MQGVPSWKTLMTAQHAPSSGFRHFAVRTAEWVGSAGAFLTAVLLVVAWGLSGPLFGYSDSWQLWINTGTTVVTFLMVFIIQYTQNREARATQIKLDELLRAIKGAHNEMMDLKDLSDDELRKLESTFDRLAHAATHVREAKAAKPTTVDKK